MTTERILWALFFSVLLGYSFSKTMDYERDANRLGVILEKQPGRITSVYVSPLFLPYLLAVITAGMLLIQGISATWEVMLSLAVEVMLALTIYYLILLAVLPLLRRCFSARFCATMWLLPVFLYWLPHMWRNDIIKPWLVLRVPPMAYQIFGIVWLSGFAVILCWKLLSHLRFRREVLRDAYLVSDPAILELWKREQELIERKKPIPLMISPYVTTPMTVGKWNSTIRTLLPARMYHEKELLLIFRHELRHVQRLDVDTKIFYGFCEAFCWFNPLVWLAMRKASADLELSCDEMVVYGMEEKDRRRYAELLLDTAGDDRGFSTCLSASAKTLRYRLKNIMEQRRRLTGSVLLTVTMAALILCGGAVVATGVYGTLDEVLFSRYEELSIHFVGLDSGKPDGYRSVYAWDEPALMNYLRTIPVTKIAGNGQEVEMDAPKELFLEFGTGESWIIFYCTEEWLSVANGDYEGVYRLEQPLDWEKIEACMDFTAENPDPGPVKPQLDYWLDHEAFDEPFLANSIVLKKTTKDDGFNVVELIEPEPAHIGGSKGLYLTHAFLEFNYQPTYYSVKVRGLNGEESYTINGKDLKNGVLELAPYSAIYSIYGKFETHRDTVYHMGFYFKIILPEE